MAVENVDCKDGNSITYARVSLRQAKSAVAHLTAFQKICVPRAQCSKGCPKINLSFSSIHHQHVSFYTQCA